jgi:hypothetical protein
MKRRVSGGNSAADGPTAPMHTVQLPGYATPKARILVCVNCATGANARSLRPPMETKP